MSRKKKPQTRRQIVDEILSSLPWQDRQKVIEAGEKHRRPADLADIEKLYNQALGKLTPQTSKEETMETKREVKTHELKVWPEFYSQLGPHGKNYEIRKNDRDYQVGDLLILKEFQVDNNLYTGRGTTATITSVTQLPAVPGLLCDETVDWVVLGLHFRSRIGHREMEQPGASVTDMVLKFAMLMEKRLDENASKGPATDVPLTKTQLFEMLKRNVHELEMAAIDLGYDKLSSGTIAFKAADVANYALFIARWAAARQEAAE